MEELISVVMSVYNEEEAWLKQSIESILTQSYRKLEYIIVLDNPENETLKEILEAYARKDSRIRLLINEKNVGLIKSMNRALKEVRGTLVARMDADDISYPNRLELEYKAMRKYGVDFVMGTVDYLDEDENLDTHTFEKAYQGKTFRRIQKIGNVSAHPTWLVKKEVYDRLMGYREVECCEDVDFLLRALQEGYECMRLSDHILKYRMRKSGISRSRALEQFMRMRYLRGLYRRNRPIKEAAPADWNAQYNRITEKQKQRFQEAMGLLWKSKLYFAEHKYMKCFGNLAKGMVKSRYFLMYVMDNLIWMAAVKMI